MELLTNNEEVIKSNKRPNEENVQNETEVKRKKCIQQDDTLSNGRPNLFDLPNEILLLIFRYLDSVDLMDVCLTCERFFEIIKYEKSLWKSINIRDIYITKDIFKQYMTFANEFTEKIYIIGYDSTKKILRFDNLCEIKTKCPNLQVLHIENQALDALEVFVSVFPPNLKELSLANCNFYNSKYIQGFFAGIDSYFTNLETLILTNCCWFLTHSIMAISKLPKLKYLYLDGCLQLYNFMPYLSLSTRYGFKNLEFVDLRRTKVSDSEVSCFNATKTLKALYLEYVSVSPQSNTELLCDIWNHYSEVTNDSLKEKLNELGEIVRNTQKTFDELSSSTSTEKVKILKTNFNSLLQEIGNVYSKSGFHKLFYNMQNLQKLVNLITQKSNKHEDLCITEFQSQQRLQKFTTNGTCDFRPCDSTTIENSIPCSSKISETDNKLLTSHDSITIENNIPSSSENSESSNKQNTSPCHSTTFENNIPCSSKNSESLDKEFIRMIKRITNQTNDSDDFEYDEENHRNNMSNVNNLNNTIVITFSDNSTDDGRCQRSLRRPAELIEISPVSNRTIHALFNQRSECINLERVSFRGYTDVTDEGLLYLARARQSLISVDVRETGVSKNGCLKFKIQRPWCELKCDFDI